MRAVRAARRQRRRLAAWCAVIVAFCFGVTILIVIMAGNRTPGSGVVPALVPAAVAGGGPASFPSLDHGAGAPDGGRG